LGESMKEFEIFTQKTPEQISNILDSIAAAGINIKAISTERRNNDYVIKIVTSDEATTEKTLARNKVKYNINDIITIQLIDRPGELAKITKMLAKKKINIESIYILEKGNGETSIALLTDDNNKTYEIFKQALIKTL
jgi:hypothetical protein